MIFDFFSGFNHNEIKQAVVAKGPPTIRVNVEQRKQEDELPRNPLQVYDTDGTYCKLYFETEGLFIKYKSKNNASNTKSGKTNKENERIFYHEIRNYNLIPTEGHERFYMNLILHTSLGKRVYYYLPLEYRNIIKQILRDET